MSDLRDITERIEREEFARGHIEPGETPVPPRSAATLVLAWAGRTEPTYQVLLLRRPETARFAPGAYVFAGGVLDPEDAEPEALDLLPPSLREPEGPAMVAALRELFEETGFLLSDRPVDEAEARRARTSLLSGDASLAEVAADLGATFHGLRAAYMSRWVTPARFARRYDTRFFVASLSGPEPPTPELTPELAGHIWLQPAEAVRRFIAGELPMLFPTRCTLQALAEHPGVEQVFASLADAVPEAIEPRLVVRGDSVRPVLPDDPEYGEGG